MSVDPKTQSLFDAIQASDYHLVKLIVESGVSVNIPNDRGATPLAIAYRLLMTAGAKLAVSTPPQTIANGYDRQTYTRPEGGQQPSESPVRTDRIPQKDLMDFMEPNSSRNPANNPVNPTRAAERDNRPPLEPTFQNHSQERNTIAPSDNLQRSEPEDTNSFDLDAMFDESNHAETDLSVPNLSFPHNSFSVRQQSAEPMKSNASWDAGDIDFGFSKGKISPGNVEEGETYAIDLDFGNPLGKISPGNVEEGETYAIDLDFGNPLGKISPGNVEEGETYAIDLDFGNPLGKISPGNVEEGETYAIDLDFGNPLTAEEIIPNFQTTRAKPTSIPDRSPATHSVPTYEENATNSSLMSAVMDGDLELVQESISKGNNPNRYDWELGYAPLGMAIERGQIEIVRFLLTIGANPYSGSLSTNALGLAANCGESEIVKLLLQMGVEINIPVDRDDSTALMYAVKSSDLTTVQTLLEVGANPNVWIDGKTPILLAAELGYQDIYQYLYPLVSEEIRRRADVHGQELLQATLKRRVREQNRPIEKLIAMATEGNLEEVKRAIELGIDINTIGSQGYNALMAAAYYGHISVLEVLLAAGANPNLFSDSKDGWGKDMTALAIASKSFFASNRHEVVKVLVAGGADVNQPCAGGKTPLMYAATAGSGYHACVQSLIAAGADLNLCDDNKNTVLRLVMATGNQSLYQLLRQAGATTGD
jgi:ankyrin repeat protein